MERRTEQRTWDGWTFRESIPITTPPERLVLLIHGWTGDENSMWVFARDFPLSAWLIAPRAPYRAERKGFSWRRMRPGTWGWPTFQELRPAAEAMLTWLDGLMRHREWTFSQMDVMGFSQGAALTSVLLAVAPERIRRAALLAGFLPPGTEPYLDASRLQGKPIFLSHGQADQLVPFARAEGLAQALEEAGAEVQFCAHPMGHKVSAPCLQVMKQYFSAGEAPQR